MSKPSEKLTASDHAGYYAALVDDIAEGRPHGYLDGQIEEICVAVGLETVNLSEDVARRLGEMMAWIDNKIMDTDVTGGTEIRRMQDISDRLERMHNTTGHEGCDVFDTPPYKAFAAGYDAVIDFSLNADWRDVAQ